MKTFFSFMTGLFTGAIGFTMLLLWDKSNQEMMNHMFDDIHGTDV